MGQQPVCDTDGGVDGGGFLWGDITTERIKKEILFVACICSSVTRMLLQGFSDERIKGVCGTSDEEIAECWAIIQEKRKEMRT